jgi:hypothetical protein
VADIRTCAQCDGEFSPQREHARFCSPRCRIAWNRRNALDPAAEGTLPWALTAMRAAADRLLAATARDPGTAFMVVSEAVWWVTLVDATLVRYHDDAYGHLLASLEPARRRETADTFGGLRFVRNQIGRQPGPGDLICRPRQAGAACGRVAGWTWNPDRKPAPDAQPGPGRYWELARHRSYQSQLAGRPVGDSFTCAAGFLHQAWTATLDQHDPERAATPFTARIPQSRPGTPRVTEAGAS